MLYSCTHVATVRVKGSTAESEYIVSCWMILVLENQGRRRLLKSGPAT